MDSTGELYSEPAEGSSKGAFVFFMLVIIFGNFLFLQVFIAILFEQYMLLRCLDEGSVVTPQQLKQIEFEDRLIVDIGPPQHLKEPRTKLGQWARAVTEHRYFIRLDTTVVALNIAVLLTTHESQSDGVTMFQEAIGVACAFAFIVELTLQLLSVGPAVYFSTTENNLNAVVTLVSLVDVVSTLATGVHCTAQAALLKVIRCLRVMRGVKRVARMPSVRVVLISLLRPMPTLLSLVLIIVITIISWSNCGYVLFGKADHTEFRTMGDSIKTLVYAATGEVWTGTFTVAMNLEPDVPRWLWVCVTVLFFYSFMLVTSLLMLNMFIMVVVDSYDLVSDGTWGLDQVEILAFKSAWLRIDKDNTGLASHNDIVRMVRRLPSSVLGIEEGKLATYKQCFYYVKELNLENFQTARQLYQDHFPMSHEMRRRDGKIHFHKVLLAVNRLAYKRKQFADDSLMVHSIKSKISERAVMEEKAAFVVMRAIQFHVFRQRCAILSESIREEKKRAAKEPDGQGWQQVMFRRINAGEFRSPPKSPRSTRSIRSDPGPDGVVDDLECPPTVRGYSSTRGAALPALEGTNRSLSPQFDEETKTEGLKAAAARVSPGAPAPESPARSSDGPAPPPPPATPTDGSAAPPRAPSLGGASPALSSSQRGNGRRGARRLKKPAKALHKPAHTPASTPRTTPRTTPRNSFSVEDAQTAEALALRLANLPTTPRAVLLGADLAMSPVCLSPSGGLSPSGSNSRLRQLARPSPGSSGSDREGRSNHGSGAIVSSPTGSTRDMTI